MTKQEKMLTFKNYENVHQSFTIPSPTKLEHS